MPPTYRSRRARLAAQSRQLRAAGQTWTQIAAVIRAEEHVNARVAMRMAHGITQAQVARLWNERWSADAATPGLTDKNISYWETWPESGHEPSLKTLKRLAQLYECDVGDLIDDGNYSHLDQAAGQADSGVIARSPDTALSIRPVPSARTAPVIPTDPGLPDELAPLHQLAQLAQQPNRSPRERELLYQELVRFLAAWADSMKRRELLRVLSCAATAAVATPLFRGLSTQEQARMVQVLNGRHRIDGTIIGHVESVLWSAMRQDDALGPQAALDTALAQRNLVQAMLPECPEALKPRLLSVFGNLSRFAGWLSFDLNDPDSALYYYEQARSAAHEAENTELGTFVLCNLSQLATWRGEPRVGIDHAVAAQAWTREIDDRLLRAYVADVAARAYSTAGMQRQCHEALDSIPDDLDDAANSPATSFAYFYCAGGYASTRARSLLLLGQPPQALAAARQALAHIDPSFVRNRAFSTLWLSHAYRASGEIEEAARVIGNAAELAAHNRSVRLADELRRSRSRLDRWQQTTAVRELDDRLAAYGWERSSIT